MPENGVTKDSSDGGASMGPDPAPRPPLMRSKSRVPVERLLDKPLLAQANSLVQRRRKDFQRQTAEYGWYDWLAFFIPCLRWLRTYDVRAWLLWDVLAGLSVGAMVIPQGMSYANLAGLPQVYGLYGTFVPCLVYAVLGSSRQLAVGPVAVTSILLGNGLSDLFSTGGGSPCIAGTVPTPPANSTAIPVTCAEYSRAAVQIAFLAGLMCTGIGLLRLGWITYFLSHATISGFMSGAAITIALSQVKYILGLSIPRADKLVEELKLIFGNLSQFKWQEFCMGMAFIFVLLVFRYLSRNYRRLRFMRALGPITVCVLSIALMNIFKWYRVPAAPPTLPPTAPVAALSPPPPAAGRRLMQAVVPAAVPPSPPPPPPPPAKASPAIKPIGVIPKGMPPFTASWWLPLYNTGRQLLLAVVICLIGLCESISIAKALAQKNKYSLDATQELLGLGLANLAGAMFSSYTTTGSFSRSAVADSTGAKTPLAGFVTGLMVMFVLLLLTPVFTNMSANVQGAIIIVGVLGLFQWEDFLYAWRVSKLGWLEWVATFLCTIFLGIEIGILVGVAVSLVLVIYKTAFPRITTIGRLPGTTIYRNVAMYSEAESPAGMILLRIDAPIFFANIEGIKDYLFERLRIAHAQHNAEGDPCRFVIIDLSPSPDIDISGLHLIETLLESLSADGIQLLLANPAKSVVMMLKRAGLLEKLGEHGVQVSVGEAVWYANGYIQDAVAAEVAASL